MLAVALVSAAFGLQLRDAIAAVVVARATDLADLSLEELGNVVVASVSRRQERLAAAPASIYVISREDIRRSGVTSLPEALRLAPHLQVARADRVSLQDVMTMASAIKSWTRCARLPRGARHPASLQACVNTRIRLSRFKSSASGLKRPIF